MSKHTPGPWNVMDGMGTIWVCANTPEGHPYHKRTVKTEIMSDEDYPTKEGDARLIAAAPELLEMLKFVESQWPVWMGTPSTAESLKKIRAIISKAEGSTETEG